MRELIQNIAKLIVSSPRRDERRDQVLEKLRILSGDEERRRIQIADAGSDPAFDMSIDVRAARFSAAIKPIDAFTPREMGQVIVWAARVFSPLTRNLDSINEMWRHLPGGMNFRITTPTSWEEEVAIRFDILPYAFQWIPPLNITEQYNIFNETAPFRLIYSRRLAKKINAVGFEVSDIKPTPIFYFENEQDQVLGILSV